MYTADKWLEKNKGALHNDLVGMLQLSDDETLSKLFFEWKPKSPSVSFVYRASLRALSDTMGKTQQHYIRCIKPNVDKKPDYFCGQVVTRQLQYTGCSAVVEIQRTGYPISLTHLDFVRQYRCIAFDRPALLNDASLSSADICKNILKYAQQEHSSEKDGESWLSSLRVQVASALDMRPFLLLRSVPSLTTRGHTTHRWGAPRSLCATTCLKCSSRLGVQ